MVGFCAGRLPVLIAAGAVGLIVGAAAAGALNIEGANSTASMHSPIVDSLILFLRVRDSESNIKIHFWHR